MSYSPGSIWVNHREAKLSEVLSGKLAAASEFESETFSFIKNWLQGVDLFTLQTSGSTGTPKEITLTRNQLVKSAQRTISTIGLSEKVTALVCLDTKYIAGKMMLVRALEGNMKIVAVEPASNPLENLSAEILNGFAAFVPMQLQEMLKVSENLKRLSQFKAIIVGGGAVSNNLLKQIQEISCPVFATYGMTETVSHIALQRLNGDEASDHFRVLPEIKIQLDNRSCLVIRMPEFTEKIVTNDLVEIISSDQFRWLGRFDNVINSGGFKISPEKIEKAIERILSTDQSFFVTGIPDERLGEKLVLILEGKDHKLDLTKLTGLHPFEIPKDIRFIMEFIRTETGKVNRNQTKLLANS